MHFSELTHLLSIAGDPPAADFYMKLDVVQNSPQMLRPQGDLFKSPSLTISVSSKKCNPRAALDQSSGSGTPI